MRVLASVLERQLCCTLAAAWLMIVPGACRAFIPPELGYKDCKKDEPQPPTFATKRQLVRW